MVYKNFGLLSSKDEVKEFINLTLKAFILIL